MKTVALLKAGILVLLAIQMSCSKEIDTPDDQEPPARQEPPVSLSEMLTCHRLSDWDLLAVQTQLLGEWEWEYIQCYWSPEKGNYKDFEGLMIKFKSDNTLEVKANGQTTQVSTWEVVPTIDGNYRLDVDPIVLVLPGIIRFCEERVLFNDSYVDGCDNYFKKMD